jgi:general secretion pathway protein F
MRAALSRVAAAFASGRRILSRTELEFFVRQLSSLLVAGIPLDQALSAMATQARAPVAAVIESLRVGLREGLSLRQAMAQFPADFDETLRSLVGVGESSGSLASVLDRLAQSMADANRLRIGLLSALAYPLIVCLVALVVVVALMSYVVPQIVSVLVSQKQSLPFLTRALIAVSEFLQLYGFSLLVGFLLALFSFVLSYMALIPNADRQWPAEASIFRAVNCYERISQACQHVKHFFVWGCLSGACFKCLCQRGV